MRGRQRVAQTALAGAEGGVHRAPHEGHISVHCPGLGLGQAAQRCRQLGEVVFKRFNADAGKAGVVGYYRGLVAAYQATGHHTLLVAELDRTISALESETATKGIWPLPAVAHSPADVVPLFRLSWPDKLRD